MSKRKPLTEGAKEHMLQTALASVAMANAMLATLVADQNEKVTK